MATYDLGKVVGDTGQQGAKGDTGNGIQSISKVSTSGLVDTYRITFTNGNTTTFTVTNINNTQYAQMTMPNRPVQVRMECTSTNTLVYVNNSLFATVPTQNWVGVGMRTYKDRSMTIKDIKIKTIA